MNNLSNELILKTGLNTADFHNLWNCILDINTMKDFNGHFWIEKNNEVFDNYPFHIEIDSFKKAFNIKNKNAKLEYERCDDETTNKLIFAIWKKGFEKSGYSEETVKDIISIVWKSPEPRCCYYNCITQQKQIDGKIVFGSVFMRSDDGTKKHYIIGLPNAKTLYDFKKEYDPFVSLF